MAEKKPVPTINHLSDIPKESRIIIYGCGKRGDDLFDALAAERPDVNIVAFADSFSQGEHRKRKKMLPDELAQRIHDFDIIAVASEFATDIIGNAAPVLQEKMVEASWRAVQAFNIRRGKGPYFQGVTVELSRRCDMRCGFCVAGRDGYFSKDMNLETFNSIVARIGETDLAKRIAIVGAGEPLLHPNIIQAVAACTNSGLGSSITTNGLSLSPTLYSELSKAGLETLSISIHNLSQAGFDDRHAVSRQIDFDQYIDTVLECIDIHYAQGLKTQIGLTLMIASEHWVSQCMHQVHGVVEDTKHFMKRFTPLYERIRSVLERRGISPKLDLSKLESAVASYVNYKKMDYNFLHITDDIYLQLDPLEPFPVGLARKYTPHVFDDYDFRAPEITGCEFVMPYVRSTGEVFPCCNVPEDKKKDCDLSLGTISEETPIDVLLRSEQLLTILDQAYQGKLSNQSCRECMGTYFPIKRA